MAGETIRIHYRRPPDREQTYMQRLAHREAGCAITLLEQSGIAERMVIDGLTALEPGSPVVWFTFDGAWHDIGVFHDAAGRRTGVYANVLTPVTGFDTVLWETTDLFLDVWRGPTGAVSVLDVDELEAAVSSGWVDEATARRARAEAARLLALYAQHKWPPPIVRRWTLERARAAVAR